MDYSKYVNKLQYPSKEDLKKYEEELSFDILNTTTTGKELKRMFDEIPERVKQHKKSLNDKYQKENARLYMLFRSDALKEAGLSYLPEDFQGRIFGKAWEDGHSCGYSEVFNYLLGYADLFDGYDVVKINS